MCLTLQRADFVKLAKILGIKWLKSTWKTKKHFIKSKNYSLGKTKCCVIKVTKLYLAPL